jgi:hypothetical protein
VKHKTGSRKRPRSEDQRFGACYSHGIGLTHKKIGTQWWAIVLPMGLNGAELKNVEFTF